MFRLPFRRRSRSARLLAAPRAGLERVAEAISQAALADVFADLAVRSGVDLGDAAERVIGHLGDAVTRAESSAGVLADAETARQLREIAVHAAGRAAELAYMTGAERLIGRRRHSNRGLLLLSVAAGLAAGGAVAYLLVSRRAQNRQAPGALPAGQALVQSGQVAAATVASPFQQTIGRFQQRLRAAVHAALDAQAESERRLWHEYRTGGPPTYSE